MEFRQLGIPRLFASQLLGFAVAMPEQYLLPPSHKRSHDGTRKGGFMPKVSAVGSKNGFRAVQTDVKARADQVTRSLGQIQATLRRTERKIEKDARERIRLLRKEAKKQAAVVRGHQREAQRILRRLSIAGEESWGDMKRAAYRAIADARTVADSLRERFRRAVGES